MRSNEVDIQRKYYADTAVRYEQMHIAEDDEHAVAMSLLVSMLDYYQIGSILDIGSGTGRALKFLKRSRPDIQIVGIEPVKELRDVGHANGLTESELIDGDATNLELEAGAFDLVCEFGVLHHIRRPERAVSEMLRVSKKAVFISDANNFGQGAPLARFLKQAINMLGLWPIANFVKTKGRGYSLTEGDGLAYSYSVFNNYSQIKRECRLVHIFNTLDGGVNPYRSASHIALLGIKKAHPRVEL